MYIPLVYSSFVLLCIPIHYVYRQEYLVQKFEGEHGVLARWTTNSEEYREAMKIAKTGKQQQLKQAMLTCARERVFYLNTLTHHAGMLKHAILNFFIIIIQY